MSVSARRRRHHRFDHFHSSSYSFPSSSALGLWRVGPSIPYRPLLVVVTSSRRRQRDAPAASPARRQRSLARSAFTVCAHPLRDHGGLLLTHTMHCMRRGTGQRTAPSVCSLRWQQSEAAQHGVCATGRHDRTEYRHHLSQCLFDECLILKKQFFSYGF